VTTHSSEAGEMPLRELFALNVLVQLADGLLTYAGLELGFVEGNPILLASMSTLGVGTALLLFKAYACGLLLLLRWHCAPARSALVFLALALIVTLAALVPWIGKCASFAAFVM
jgi:hypothetical protein